MPLSLIRLWALNYMQDGREFEGVRLGSGQDIFCKQIVVDSSITIPSSVFPDKSDDPIMPKDSNLEKIGSISKVTGKVARMICITRHSVKPGLSNLLVFFPPKCKKLKLSFMF